MDPMRVRSLIASISTGLVAVLASSSASANWVGQVPACGGCGPTQTAEFFIHNDTGAGGFDSTAITGLPAGWSATRVNANYALATGPSDNLSAWLEHFAGNPADTLQMDIFFWSGGALTSTISFAANYLWSNGAWSLNCQNFGAGCATQVDATGVRYDRAGSVPEPGSFGLAGLALLGLAQTRRRARA